MDGIINVYKPLGMTSHDVVYRMRRITGIRTIGHTGTLDPDACGVLPICIGKGTKAADMLTFSDKRYTALLRLGITTDTQDTTGRVERIAPVDVSDGALQQAIACFVGDIAQIPPMYSAVKIGGKKLYELARKGVTVERKPRQITVYSIDILHREGPDVTIDVHCSKGSYIRTLCHDIGAKLGCGGAMAALERTQSGGFTVDQSVALDRLDETNWQQYVVPLDTLFPYPSVTLDEAQQRKVRNGVAVAVQGCAQGQQYRVYGPDGTFLCLSVQREGMLVMEKGFYSNQE